MRDCLILVLVLFLVSFVLSFFLLLLLFIDLELGIGTGFGHMKVKMEFLYICWLYVTNKCAGGRARPQSSPLESVSQIRAEHARSSAPRSLTVCCHRRQ
jgi:hypothetical protein